MICCHNLIIKLVYLANTLVRKYNNNQTNLVGIWGCFTGQFTQEYLIGSGLTVKPLDSVVYCRHIVIHSVCIPEG